MMKSFSPTAALSFGWETFKKNKKFWVIGTVLMFLIGNGGGLDLGNSFSSDDSETTVEQNVNYNNTNQINIYNGQNDQEIPNLNQMMEESGQTVPLVPEKVDGVLGISDKFKNGETTAAIVLFVLVVFILMLPYFILSLLVGGGVQMGITRFFLNAARGQEVKYEHFLSEINLSKAYRYLAATFLYTLLVVVGLILFIIPGIYFAIKYGFYTYAIVDKNATIGESFSLSSKITKGYKWKLIGLGILAVLLNVLGVIALLYGLLVTVPVTLLASAYAYDQLSKSSA